MRFVIIVSALLLQASGVPSQAPTFDANDRLNSDTSDNNGNTTGSDGSVYSYDFENRLIRVVKPDGTLIQVVYDGDGNRVSKTVAGVTTKFLVDTNNLTGYAQVLEELDAAGTVQVAYAYGLDLISQTRSGSTTYYGYDGHGSVRHLSDAAGTVTDTWDYDAFGILIARTGTTPNLYLYAGEQWDEDLGMYFLRARYMQPGTGRFWTMDRWGGDKYDAASLHKYAYCKGNAPNVIDPSGRAGMMMQQTQVTATIGTIQAGQATTIYTAQAAATQMGVQASSAYFTGSMLAGGSAELLAYGGMAVIGGVIVFHAMAETGGGGVAAPDGPPPEKEDDKQDKRGDYVYRGLSRWDLSQHYRVFGLSATAPGRGDSPYEHVRFGGRPSQWISATYKLAIAQGKYGKHGVIRINLRRVRVWVDLSLGIRGHETSPANNFARFDKDVVIKDYIPPDAIEDWMPPNTLVDVEPE
jgi:RHS repeat-associated protein